MARVHSVLQRFLCPWHKLRAKTVFRDVSCLPAGSRLETELFARMDRSKHFLVFASPDAAHSRTMEAEAHHWFDRTRDGEVIVIVTDPGFSTWGEIREHLLPSSIRTNLEMEPLWVALHLGPDEALSHKSEKELREQLTEGPEASLP